jgi:hypothetical protein
MWLVLNRHTANDAHLERCLGIKEVDHGDE